MNDKARRRPGLHRSLLLGYLALMLILVVGPHALLGELIKRRMNARVRSEMERVTSLVATQLEQLDAAQRPALQDFVVRLAQPLGIRVTLVAPGGQVVADSHVPAGAVLSLPGHADREEVRAALEGRVAEARRRSQTVDRELLYVARPAGARARQLDVAVVRAAMDLAEVQQALVSMRDAIGYSATGALLCGVLVSILLARRLTRALRELEGVASALVQGDAPPPPRPSWEELTSLDRALRQLGAELRRRAPEVRQERAQVRALLESTSDALLLVAPDGSVLEANAPARQALQIAERDAPVRIGELRQEEIRGAVARVLGSGQPLEVALGDDRFDRAMLFPIPGATHTQGVVVRLSRRPPRLVAAS